MSVRVRVRVRVRVQKRKRCKFLETGGKVIEGRQREAENASSCHTDGSMIALQGFVQGNQRTRRNRHGLVSQLGKGIYRYI